MAAAEAFAATPTAAALPQTSPAALEAFQRQFQCVQAAESVTGLEQLPTQVPHPRTTWVTLRVPALVLAYRDDSVHPFELAQALAAGLPGAQVCEVASRHTQPAQHVVEVQQAVETFLSEHGLT